MLRMVIIGRRRRQSRAEKKDSNSDHQGNEEYNFFMAVLFPDDQLEIFDYNRVVKDLNGLSPSDF